MLVELWRWRGRKAPLLTIMEDGVGYHWKEVWERVLVSEVICEVAPVSKI
jgi:hypothetical protein